MFEEATHLRKSSSAELPQLGLKPTTLCSLDQWSANGLHVHVHVPKQPQLAGLIQSVVYMYLS